MFFSFPGVLTIIVLVVILPILFFLGVFNLLTTGLQNLGFSNGMALTLLGLIIVGSFINIPLTRTRIVEVEESDFFGLMKRRGFRPSGVAINLGGAIIPLFVVLYLIPGIPGGPALIATVLMIVISFAIAKASPKRGITLPMLLPPLFAALFALILAPHDPAPVAFVSGVIGVLIGADLLRLPQMNRDEGMLVIGGAGVFDAVFLVGVISALLAGI